MTRAVVLMGVSGAGKTRIGRLLAAELGWAFLDADDLHPVANREKMASGRPLDDADRRPWLRRVRRAIEGRLERREAVVVACSALKRAYRDLLRRDLAGVQIVHLRGDAGLIASRLAAREGHFMPPGLLASQLEALEEPSAKCWTVDVNATPEAIAARIRALLEASEGE